MTVLFYKSHAEISIVQCDCVLRQDVSPLPAPRPQLAKQRRTRSFNILKEINEISGKGPKERSNAENKSLKAYNKKLKKFEKEIVDGVLKKYSDLQKKTKDRC